MRDVLDNTGELSSIVVLDDEWQGLGVLADVDVGDEVSIGSVGVDLLDKFSIVDALLGHREYQRIWSFDGLMALRVSFQDQVFPELFQILVVVFDMVCL